MLSLSHFLVGGSWSDFEVNLTGRLYRILKVFFLVNYETDLNLFF